MANIECIHRHNLAHPLLKVGFQAFLSICDKSIPEVPCQTLSVLPDLLRSLGMLRVFSYEARNRIHAIVSFLRY